MRAHRPVIAPYAPPYPFVGDLHVYDPVTATWTDLSAAASGTPPLSRCWHGFAGAGLKLYVHGGIRCDFFQWNMQEYGMWLSDMYVYDTVDRSWTDLSSPASGIRPYGRYGHGFVALGSKLYVHGLSYRGYSESATIRS